MYARRYGLLSMGTSAFATILQGLTLAITYWLLKRQWGAEHLGAWSIIVSILMFGRIAEFGMGQSLIGLLPKALASGDRDAARNTYVTVMAVTLAIFAALALPAYIAGTAVLAANVPKLLLPEVRRAFAVALAGFVFANIALTTASAANGLGRVHLSNGAAALGALANLVATVMLISTRGVEALAWGNLAAGIVTFAAGTLVVAGTLGSPLALAHHFKPALLKDFMKFGVSMQAISIASALTDLVVKLSVTRLSGIEATGVYEQASRYVLFLRGLLGTSQSYIGGVISRLHHRDGDVAVMLTGNSRLSISLGLFYVSLTMIFAGLVAHAWTGEHAALFYLMVSMLVVGWALNVVVSPLYYAMLGIGNLSQAIVTQALYFGLTAAGCFFIFSNELDGIWAVGSISFALAFSQVYLFRQCLNRWTIRLADIADRYLATVAICSFASIAIAIAVENGFGAEMTDSTHLILASLIGLVYVAVYAMAESRTVSAFWHTAANCRETWRN